MSSGVRPGGHHPVVCVEFGVDEWGDVGSVIDDDVTFGFADSIVLNETRRTLTDTGALVTSGVIYPCTGV